MLVRARPIHGRRAETGAQPPYLPAVVDLVLGNVEPRPVRVHCRGSAERPLQPRIITSGKALERDTAYFAELVNVVLEGFAAQETAPLGAECEGGLPRRLFQRRRPSLLERETLIPALHHGDVSQQRANRVTRVVVQMIEFRDAQSCDGG